jgi:hypothetical protein
MTDATRMGGARPATHAGLFVAKRREGRSRVSDDDVLYGYRLRLFALAAEIGVRAACRAMGVHQSTYYRWKARVDRWGLEALRPRERRRPRNAETRLRNPRAVDGVIVVWLGPLLLWALSWRCSFSLRRFMLPRRTTSS